MPKPRHQDYIRFLEAVDATVAAGKVVHAIVDNYATHKHPEVREWQQAHPWWTFHFTPTPACWLNAIEGFFAKLTKKLCQTCGLDLAGLRDRALFLIGFAGAMRRSELVGLDVDHVTWTANGLKLLIERSKTDAGGEGAEIANPRGRSEETCPVMSLKRWLEAAEITPGQLFRKVNRGGKVQAARLTPDGVRPCRTKRSRAILGTIVWRPWEPMWVRAAMTATSGTT
jgi:hypothetical protein